MVVSARANVLGVRISATNMEEAVLSTDELLQSDLRGYVCVTGVHGVVEAQSDDEFRSILNSSFITTPDGTPVVWVGWAQGFKTMRRVYGPDYMIEICKLSVRRGYKHFLYGGNIGVAQQLATELERRFPGIAIVGAYTPPFRPLNAAEEAELISIITTTKPDVMWIGLSTPKQERFMAAYMNKLDIKLMAGVGAAFDIHTGRIKDAPIWMKVGGLQWFHRLVQDPLRLWRRYFIINPKFIWSIGLQFVGLRRYRAEK